MQADQTEGKSLSQVRSKDYAAGKLKMNARPENPDENHRGDASGDDPGIATIQLGWFC